VVLGVAPANGAEIPRAGDAEVQGRVCSVDLATMVAEEADE